MGTPYKYSLDTFGVAARTAFGTRGNGKAYDGAYSGNLIFPSYRPFENTGGPWWDPRYSGHNAYPAYTGRLVAVMDYATSSTAVSLPPDSQIIMGTPIPPDRRVIAFTMGGNGMGSTTSSGGTVMMQLYDTATDTFHDITSTMETDVGVTTGGMIRRNSNTFYGGGFVTTSPTFMIIKFLVANWNVAGGKIVATARYIDV